jgi:hypothetical protein
MFYMIGDKIVDHIEERRQKAEEAKREAERAKGEEIRQQRRAAAAEVERLERAEARKKQLIPPTPETGRSYVRPDGHVARGLDGGGLLWDGPEVEAEMLVAMIEAYLAALPPGYLKSLIKRFS